MPVLLVLLAVCSVWRLSRLIAVDTIFAPLRGWVGGRDEWFGFLVSCPWCVSVWLSFPAAWAVVYFPTNRMIWVAAIALTGSLAAGMGQTLEDRLDR
jgi:hypothetical protein